MPDFKVKANYIPKGDQPQAIESLTAGFKNGLDFQTLIGVTGSGKTYTMAKVIEKLQVPALIISHNKTLAAQLYREFKDYFPDNAVAYFVSYYDYYQPEAYVASRDLYIEKETQINDEIDRLRLAATSSLLERKDVIVVATVSCIYGLGNPVDYKESRVTLKKGMEINRDDFIRKLVHMQYLRNDDFLDRGNFRVRGDVLEIVPSYAKQGLRIDFFGDEIEEIYRTDILNASIIERLDQFIIYPAKHFITREDIMNTAVSQIRHDLKERHEELLKQGKDLEAKRLQTRTLYDVEMLMETGYCSGIENYSIYFSNRQRGERPAVLLDFFPEDFVVFIDESHVTIPQIGGMYAGDRSRKQSLVDHGFRLPTALDNRPLIFDEFEKMAKRAIYVSATPADYERNRSQATVELFVRPTGLLDPEIEVRKTENQIDDLLQEIHERVDRKERVLITTLTKRMAEDLTDYLAGKGVKVQYLHSEIETIERVEVLKGLREGTFDVLVGINLLREGLDLPEVSLVAIMDADKIGFLRSTTSLIQTSGRAARNVNGKVIMYADRMSQAMQETIEITDRRRKIQIEYNEKHNITPKTITKSISAIIQRKKQLEVKEEEFELELLKKKYNLLIPREKNKYLKDLQKEMTESAKRLEFEKAALLRDEIKKIKEQNL